MPNIEGDIWHWYHNISACFYHVQLTVKFRKVIFNPKVERIVLDSLKGFKERYAVDIQMVGFDQNHVHILMRFLPIYSGGKVIKIIKSISAKTVFRQAPEVKEDLWGGEFWTGGYYIATISGKGNRIIIENYIRNQGRHKDVKQLRLFEL